VFRRLLPLLVLSGLVACATDADVSVRRSDTAQDVAPVTTRTEPAPTAPTTTPEPEAAGDGVGDELFPALGNPGIDVVHYAIDLTYDPATDVVAGSVALDIVLTTDRREITLDAQGPVVSEVIVSGAVAKFRQDGPELRIALPEPGRSGHSVQVVVRYDLLPEPRPSAIGMSNGWFNTPGGSFVLNEPDGAHTWLPCNDHPSDKAGYTFTITVPAGLTAVANGALIDHRTEGAQEVWVWEESRPMATYLIQLLTGDYEIVKGSGPHGMLLLSAVLRSDLAEMQPVLDSMAPQIEFFEQYFGPYPLDRYGIAMTDSFGGLAMETQERSLFSRDDFLGFGPQEMLLSHELAHQWFGDAVTPARWQDIWLNESFATYGQWLWLEHIGEQSVDAAAGDALRARFPGSTGEPSVPEMFSFNTYDGGAVVLHALRLQLGDDAFFELLQRWVAENNGTSRTTEDFIDLAEKIADEPLDEFFETWLYAEQLPTQFLR